MQIHILSNQRQVGRRAAHACCVALLIASPLFAIEPPAVGSTPASGRNIESRDALPPPLTHYRGREIAPTMGYQGADWLVRESRAREENSPQLLRALKLRAGQTVCDIGCGNGYYTLELARQIGSRGRVLAVDIQPEMLHLLELRAEEAGLENIKPIQGTLVDPKLPENSVDVALLVDVYHEFSHPEHMLQAIRRSLKPDGRMILVEFREEDPQVPIKPLHKMSKKQILKEIPPNGFRLVDEYNELPWQHVIFFERTDPSEPGAPHDEDVDGDDKVEPS